MPVTSNAKVPVASSQTAFKCSNDPEDNKTYSQMSDTQQQHSLSPHPAVAFKDLLMAANATCATPCQHQRMHKTQQLPQVLIREVTDPSEGAHRPSTRPNNVSHDAKSDPDYTTCIFLHESQTHSILRELKEECNRDE